MPRRLAAIAALIPLLPGVALAHPDDGDTKAMPVYVGTYTGPGKGEGIYRLDLDPATGALANLRVAAKIDSPSFLAFRPDGRVLYAANEVGKFHGQAGGGLTALAVEPGTGHLTVLNDASTKGGGTCHVSVSPDGATAYAANYGGGSTTAFVLDGDGPEREPPSAGGAARAWGPSIAGWLYGHRAGPGCG
jgi:6-phosphogluconolactonase (cycloisomerase 2 family)